MAQLDIDDLADLVYAREHLDTEIKTLIASREEIDSVIKERLGDAEIGLVNGQPRVAWSTVVANRIDVKQLKQQDPTLAEKYTVTSTHRRFMTI